MHTGGITKPHIFEPERAKRNQNSYGMTPAKKWFIAAGTLVAAYFVWKGKTLIKDLDIQITQFGNPTIQAGVISAPVGLAIINRNLFSIPVDNLTADIYIQNNSGWLKVGSTTPTGPFTIATGQSSLVLNPNISFKAFGSNILAAIQNLLTMRPVLKIISTTTIAGKNIVSEKLAALK